MQPSAYTKINTPVALLWGNADGITPVEQGKRLALLIPRASFEAIEKVGHIPHIEAPVVTTKWILRALSAL
jgi:pimeloyl-ACP methyl ester carboxylesterase